jgi:esterase/lipase superfamily enzyme
MFHSFIPLVPRLCLAAHCLHGSAVRLQSRTFNTGTRRQSLLGVVCRGRAWAREAARLSIAIAIVLLAPSFTATSRGATILRCELAVDGSVDPPGDRIDLSVFLMPREKEVTIEVRPFLVSGDHNVHNERVKASGKRNRDAKGNYLGTVKLTRGEKSPAVDRQLIVAYADLDISRGVHQLAYEVTVIHDGKIAVVEATPLTRVTISDQPRDHMPERKQSRQFVEEKRIVQAIVLGERTRGAPAPSSMATMEVATKVLVPAAAQQVTVNIPGGFRRELVPPAAPPTPTTPVNPQDVASLANRPWYPAASVESPNDRTVFFATNRKPLDMVPPGQTPFSAEAAPQVTYGSCVVNFPVQHHTIGNLEEPSWWEQRDPSKDFLVESTKTLSKEEFARGLGPRDILLFVHGFNNSFDDAVLRAAQLQYDLEFPGPAVAFSWPSAASVSEYQTDTQKAADSTAALAETIRTLLDQTAAAPATGGKPARLHIIAHSMGNRVLLNALYALYDSEYLKPDTRPLGQIVLAAPDVGAQMFNNLIPYATDFSQQVTYYYCQTDTALIASRQINLYEPVGLLPLFEPSVRTICADRMDTSFIGHGYFSSSPKVLLDMQLIFSSGLDPDHRMPPLASHSKIFGHPYWSFTADEVAAAQDGK